MSVETKSSMLGSPAVKVVVTGLLSLVLLVPLAMVGGLVSERAGRRDAVKREIGAVWGGRQSAGAVVLTLPFEVQEQTKDGFKTCARTAYFLPDTLRIDAEIAPEVRRRSIFPVVVYRARTRISGAFAWPDLARLGVLPSAIHWDLASVTIGVADMRGVTAVSPLTWAGREVALEPSGDHPPLIDAGLRGTVALSPTAAAPIPFGVELSLAGTDAMAFVPAGKATEVTARSAWPHPGFSGAFLPETRQSAAAGFTATWKVAYFARAFPQAWLDGSIDRDQHRRRVASSEFGLDLVQTVDLYQQAERATKYGLLFILLTFASFFLWELLQSLRLHPVQYLLVGSALIVFYLLLLSISEHVAFVAAYVIAAASTVSLVAAYAAAILRAGLKGALVIGGWLATLYGLLFVLLQLEDVALLVGAIAVFAALAVVMFLTRRVEWYSASTGRAGGETGASGIGG